MAPPCICWPNVKLFLELFPSSCFLCQQPATFYCYRVSSFSAPCPVICSGSALPAPGRAWDYNRCSWRSMGHDGCLCVWNHNMLKATWIAAPGLDCHGGRGVWRATHRHHCYLESQLSELVVGSSTGIWLEASWGIDEGLEGIETVDLADN